MNKQDIDRFFEILSALNPEPKTELNYTNAYTLLIAVVMSAQSTDVGVNKATDLLFKQVQTPADMVALGEEALKQHIKTIGLFNTKAKNVFKLSEILVEKYQGAVPNDRAALESLPGVGRKTANVVLNTIFKEPVIAVDTHIFRIANRIGLAKGKTPLEVEEKLSKRIPTKWMLHAHHWLILHGRYICTAAKPKCGVCPVYDLCDYKQKVTTQDV
jgi:endonuclease III